MIRIMLLLFMLVLSACDDECIEPGVGVSSADVKVEIPVFIEGANATDKASQWIDSGVLVKADEQISVDVKKSVNLCADTHDNIAKCANSKICSKKIVPAVFCSDGSSPDYSSADKEKVEAHDPSVICAHSKGTTSNYGYYIDSDIKVNPGDHIKFNLVPSRVITVDNCHNIPPEVSQYIRDDLQSYIQKIASDTGNFPELANDIDNIVDKKLYDVCESGVDFIKLDGDQNIKIGPFKGKKFEVYVNNSFTPYGNKVYTESAEVTNYSTGERNFYGAPASSNKNAWIPAALGDPRDIFKYNEYDYDCNKPSDPALLRFNTYDVNYRCNNICREDKIWENNCVSTLRYKWDTNLDKSCVKERSRDKCRKLAFPAEKWADLLIARVGGGDGNMAKDHGKQCLPSNKKNADCMSWHSNQKDNSLQLDEYYTVMDDMLEDSRVWLGTTEYISSYHNNTGGYHVRVDRICDRTNGKDLYMYIGSNPELVVPGDPGTEEVTINFEGCAGNNDPNCVQARKLFVINSDGKQAQEGRIYFGIKGALDSDTVKSGYKGEENKYTAVVYQTKWNPIFSDFFALVRDSILEVLYGVPPGGKKFSTVSSIDIANANGIITKTYNNIIKNGLVQFVQALLVLYIAFSGLAFMLGLIQKTQMELIIRVLKIGFVLAVISPNSWEFFGVTLFNLFVKGVDQLASFFSGVIGGDDAFAFLDPTVGVILTSEFWKRLVSIMWSGPVGFFSFFLLLWGLWNFASAIIGAIIAYLMSIIALALLLSLTPLFIIAILFKVTKHLFDGWIKMLLSISIMPIILFSTLAFLHQLMMSAFYQINSFGACRGCVMEFAFSIASTQFKFCPVKLLTPSTYVYDYEYRNHINQLYATGGDNFFGLPFNLTAMIIFILSASAMKTFVHIADAMSKDIAGSMEPNLLRASGGATQGLLSLIGQDDRTKQLRAQALGSDKRKGPNEVEVRSKPTGKRDEHVDKAGKNENDTTEQKDDSRQNISGPAQENIYEEINGGDGAAGDDHNYEVIPPQGGSGGDEDAFGVPADHHYEEIPPQGGSGGDEDAFGVPADHHYEEILPQDGSGGSTQDEQRPQQRNADVSGMPENIKEEPERPSTPSSDIPPGHNDEN